MITWTEAQRPLELALNEFSPDWELVSSCLPVNLTDPRHWPSGDHSMRVTLRHRTTGVLKILGTRTVENLDASYHPGLPVRVIDAYRQGNAEPLRCYLVEVGVLVSTSPLPSYSSATFFQRPPAPSKARYVVSQPRHGVAAPVSTPRPRPERPWQVAVGKIRAIGKLPAISKLPAIGKLRLRRDRVSAPAPVASRPPGVGLLTLSTAERIVWGTFAALDLFEITQAIAHGGKSGRLAVAGSEGKGLIVFDHGRAVHAQFGELTGEEAFIALVAISHREPRGHFCFHRVDVAIPGVPRTIRRSVEHLLFSVVAQIDSVASAS